MKKALIILITLAAIAMQTTAAIGDWKIYMSYNEPQEIEAAGNYLFVRASNSLYLYNKNDQSIQTFDKTTGLSDVVINKISWNQHTKRLVIVYDNSNIDLMDINGNVMNIPDLYNKSMTGDKTVNSITNYGKYAYLATNFGGIKINVEKAEIAESYILDFGSRIIQEGNTDIFIRAIDWKVYKCPKTSNTQDKANWQQTTSWDVSLVIDNTAWDENIELVKTLQPGGPKYNQFEYMIYNGDILYSTNGTFSRAETAFVQMLKDGEWSEFENDDISKKTGVKYENLLCLDIDPNDSKHVIAGGRNGLYEYYDGVFQTYWNNANSPIEPFNGTSKEYQLIKGVKFDNNSNIYAFNCEAPNKSMLKLTKSKTWEDLDNNILKGSDGKSLVALTNPMIDSRGLMWFVNNDWRKPMVFCYDMENQKYIYAISSFINQDGKQINVTGGIHKVEEDLEHNIWIISNIGCFVIYENEIGKDNPTMTQIKIPRNDGTNLADYLLDGSDISDIIIDGGNRKWFAVSGNGIIVMSADNIVQEMHLTKDNSPLLSNNVINLCINKANGEIFINTDKGLCSFISDATQAADDIVSDNIYAYPNPVLPDYKGLITIVGLTNSSDIKIVSSNGSIIYEGKSIGGTFTWNGKDKKGNNVASGVYIAYIASSDGSKGGVCKITVLK